MGLTLKGDNQIQKYYFENQQVKVVVKPTRVNGVTKLTTQMAKNSGIKVETLELQCLGKNRTEEQEPANMIEK